MKSLRPNVWPPAADEVAIYTIYQAELLRRSESLETAVGHLKDMGFTPMQVADVPLLRGPLAGP